jgi:trans-2,3-dihydro-3-hydroxyanthranilate isomerase
MERENLADVFVFSWDSRRRTAHARLFAPGFQIPEDPACSSAALGFGLWLVGGGCLPGTDGVHEYRIRQGVELDRPATLECSVTISSGVLSLVSVSGRVVSVVRGKISVSNGSRRPLRAPMTAEVINSNAESRACGQATAASMLSLLR